MLTAISPIDGRYAAHTKELAVYFSEYALIRYRVFVEIQYFIALCQYGLPQLASFEDSKIDDLNAIFENFSLADAEQIKTLERTTNHDVKAVEYFLKERFDALELGHLREFVHFGLTSQDINNTATPLLFKNALQDVYYPLLQRLRDHLEQLAQDWARVPMLARTHGQPASPTLLGKEFRVFVERLDVQLELLKQIPHRAKFGGATGNFNAHYAAYPDYIWQQFGDDFVREFLGLERSQFTTQIEHYDCFAAQCQALGRINTILIDFCRDVWTYVSMEYFRQKTVAGEVGSSAMPHKVNPIDFENAEGNLGLANALFQHLAEKLPVSRLQRDLTDSTVLRNIGVPVGHTVVAFKSILRGLGKLMLNEGQLFDDLEDNWMVVAEGIQVILRREGYPQPYEALKNLTRGRSLVTREILHEFIDNLEVSDDVKEELKRLTPHNYVGG
ncbi:MAG: adenylosuccinate lyase [Haliscomenobacteraceae bacterium CHB4]|nr:Adenylosuccinate lyase [Saprospiraceae bacterium]MCE7922487.1 adenylosuccinate lyase [Haliscomenobacteraceae bacterium CHB4]